MKAQPHQIMVRPLVTEKGVDYAARLNQYPFEVDARANKDEIRRAVETLFNVHVQSVATMMRQGKPKRVGRHHGVTKRWKKAIVRLVPGDTIEFI